MMSINIKLPTTDANGVTGLETYAVNTEPAFWRPIVRRYPARTASFSRVVYAAAHVVPNARLAHDPWLDCKLDWDATINYRRHLWSLGMGVAEAMDTAQRGMGLDWPTSLELITRSIDAAQDFPNALVASGCGTDHLASDEAKTLDDVVRAYELQMQAIQKVGGKLIIMASRALAKIAQGPDDYLYVYNRILSQADKPVILHWLGDMFDPALKGYWGSEYTASAMSTALDVINANISKVDGIKISLLAKDREITMRRRLPKNVRMYTGDDFNYPELIAGDTIGAFVNNQRSDALLGIFDAIAPAANAALNQLVIGKDDDFQKILAPTVPLSRHIFQAPTRFYKTGVVFLAWLNGHQEHFTMVGGQQSTRSILHLSELFKLTDQAGLLDYPDRACKKMTALLSVHGIE
jgi:Protein of unknown function (DUF993)